MDNESQGCDWHMMEISEIRVLSYIKHAQRENTQHEELGNPLKNHIPGTRSLCQDINDRSAIFKYKSHSEGLSNPVTVMVADA